MNIHQLKPQIIGAKNNNHFLNFICNLYIENYSDIDKIIDFLSNLHNQQEINLFQEFLQLQNHSTGWNFWMTRNIMEKALANIQVENITEALDCINHLINGAGDDMASHTIIGKFQKKLESDAELLDKTLDAYIKNPEIYQQFTECIILAGSKLTFKKYLNIALTLLKDENIEVKCRAAFILGKLNYESEKFLLEAIGSLLSIGKNETDDKILSNALHAYIEILYENPSFFDENANNNIENILAKSDIFTFYNLSNLLFTKNTNKNTKTVEITKKLYGYLKNRKASQIGTIRNIGSSFPKHNKHELIPNYLELIEFHLENGVVFENFNLTHSILEDFELLQKIITRWLASNSANIARATKDFFQRDDKKKIEPDFEFVDSNHAHLNYFIARKAIGFLLHQPHTLTHFLVKLMDVSSDEISKDIANQIFFFILLNYPSLEEDITNLSIGLKQHTQEELQSIVNQINSYIENLKRIPTIKELRPPTEHTLAYNKRQADMMAKNYEKSSKNGLANLFSTVTMLYGDKVIFRHEDSDGSMITSEVPMSSHSYSVAVPRMIHVDNDNLEYEITKCRIERFKDEADT